MKKAFYLVLGLGIGCDVVIGAKDYSENPEQSTKECAATILSTSPYPQATDMYYRNAIVFSLSEKDSNASVQLFDAMGEPIEGSQQWRDDSLVFTPSNPLLPSHPYTASIDYCGSIEPVEIDFTTSWLGESLLDGHNMLVGKTFSVDLSSGNVVYPTGVGDLLKNLLQNTFLIQGIDAASSSVDLQLALSMANSIEQNFCVPTIDDFPALDLSGSPYFSVKDSGIFIQIGGYEMTLYDFSVSGTIAPDASLFDWIRVKGKLDLREIYPIVSDFNFEFEDADAFCSLMDGFEVPCEPCPSDGAAYCLSLDIEQLRAHEISQEIESVCAINCHELCEDNSTECENPPQFDDVCD